MAKNQLFIQKICICNLLVFFSRNLKNKFVSRPLLLIGVEARLLFSKKDNEFTINIAKRYLFAKKSTNAINIITGISVFGIAVQTAAFVLVLSVFNGFEDLLISFIQQLQSRSEGNPIKRQNIFYR
ncbi:MAG: hypothetical protein HC912_04000 [Saprospiraceae bacterium]|nr:hypothetical protein [Saprospiraceae bacterium]